MTSALQLPAAVLSIPPTANRGPQFLVAIWVPTTIAIIFVSLRIFTRSFLRRVAGWDDWTMLLALALDIPQSVLETLQIRSGLGRSIQYVQPTQVFRLLKYVSIVSLLNLAGTCCVRISVCLFSLRIIPAHRKDYRTVVYICMAMLTTASSAAIFAVAFQCKPFRGSWNADISAHCSKRDNIRILAQVLSILTAAMDMLCVALLLFLVRNLAMRKADKIGLVLVFSLGLVAAAAPIARLVLLSRNPLRLNLTWDFVPVAVWIVLEQNIGIIVACVPAIHQLYSIAKARLLLQYTASKSSNDSGNGTIQSSIRPASHGDHIQLIDQKDSEKGEKLDRIDLESNDGVSPRPYSEGFNCPPRSVGGARSTNDRGPSTA